LQEIRSSREQAQSDVEALEREKRAIQATLPKVLYELNQMRESLENKERELAVLDKAIDEIESTYGHMLFSAEFFANSANNTKS
jgi:chromosome segregation ATPase